MKPWTRKLRTRPERLADTDCVNLSLQWFESIHAPCYDRIPTVKEEQNYKRIVDHKVFIRL